VLKTKKNNWRKFRKHVMKKYNDKCVLCGSTENLEVHHILPKSKYPQYEFYINNCVPLCKSCHQPITLEFLPSNEKYVLNRIKQLNLSFDDIINNKDVHYSKGIRRAARRLKSR